MIGRFASALGWKPHAVIAAGTILVLLGAAAGGEALFAGAPAPGELVEVSGTAQRSAEVAVPRTGTPGLLTAGHIETRVALGPEGRAVLYPDILPDYSAVAAALTGGEVTVWLWPEGGTDFERRLAWQVEAGGRPVVSLDTVAEAWARERRSELTLPGGLLALGLVMIGWGLVRWRRMAAEES